MSSTYIALDLETTGLDPQRDAIIEIAAVSIRDGAIVDQWSSLVNPQCPIPEFITRLTGINTRMVEEAPTIRALRSEIKKTLADRIIIGHNVDFDLGFLDAENIPWGRHRVDTVTLASILLPEAGSYGLQFLARILQLEGFEQGQSHRALADARWVAQLFVNLKQLAREKDFALLHEVVEAGKRLGWPETIFFEEALQEAGRKAFGQAGGLRPLFNVPKPAGRQLVAREVPEPIDVSAVSGLLGPDGAFSREFPGFEHRPQQVQMLKVVAEAFNNGRHLLVEAGTGTGKSIGYLVPASFWATQNQRRVVVSTNTINLQDQLLHKDLPELLRILPFEARAAVLKGKRNYLCTRLFQQMRHSGPGNADEMALYARVVFWLPNSNTGDMAEISLRTPGERLAWDRLNAENDACSYDKCAQEECPLHLARRRAEQAHILVVNHALLLADVASENRVLPEYTDLIIDEAHHLEAAATDGLSFRVDRRHIDSLLDEVRKPRAGLLADLQRRAASALPDELSSVFNTNTIRLRENGNQVTSRLDDFFEALAYLVEQFADSRSQYAQQIRLTPAIRTQAAFDEVALSWENVNRPLGLIAEGVNKLAGGLADVLDGYDIEEGDDLLVAILSLSRGIEDLRRNLDGAIAEPLGTMIYWLESYRTYLSVHAAPLDVGPLVEEHIFKPKETVVLTSATMRTASLAGGGGEQSSGATFEYIRKRLHAEHTDEVAVGSPFDYSASTLLYLVTDIPEPNQPGYQRYVEQIVVDITKALNGRTLVLFTSYSQLEKTAAAIESALSEKGLQVLSQSEGKSRQQLLNQFRAEDSRSVLLGTRSFWEGVDVPGEALQAVVIVKFPFDVPSDPIYAARSETFDNPFYEYAIPETVLRFRQGFGRLIRRQDDEGVVVVLDKRIISKRYGQAFLEALPSCTVIRQRSDRVGELLLRWFNREKPLHRGS